MATLTRRADFMQFASTTRNNDIGESQKTSKIPSKKSLYIYSSSSINLNFLDKFEVQTSFTSQKDGKKHNSTTPDDRILQRCSKARTPKDVYT